MAKVSRSGTDGDTVSEQRTERRTGPLERCPKCGLVKAAPVFKLIGLRYRLDHMRCTNPYCELFEP
jgi:hypothetical protein